VHKAEKSASEPTGMPDDISDWKTYRNEKYGFEIKCPADSKYSEESDKNYLDPPTAFFCGSGESSIGILPIGGFLYELPFINPKITKEYVAGKQAIKFHWEYESGGSFISDAVAYHILEPVNHWKVCNESEITTSCNRIGINALNKNGLQTAQQILSTFKFKINRSAPWILTPHRGEASRLLNCKMQELPKMSAEIARRIVKKYSGSICLLKGPGTLVTDGKHFFENSTGNPAMATAGMGDVLTGIIASLWAQQSNKNVFTGVQAASIGAYLHGLAGDLALKQYPERTLLASDLADLMPVVFRKILKGRKK
jgi:hypothetical protein